MMPSGNGTNFEDAEAMLGFTAGCAFLFAIIGTLGNLLTIFALGMSRKLRTPATMFVINLAVAELLFCVVILPMSGAQYVYLQYFNEPLLSDDTCNFFTITRYTVTQAELQTIVAISLTRAIAVGSPGFYQKVNSNIVTLVYIICIWLYSFFLKLPTGLGIFGSYVFNHQTMECDLSKTSKLARSVALFVEVLVPVLTIFVLYIYIFVMVRKSSLRVNKAAKGTPKSVSKSCSSDPNESSDDTRKSSSSSFKSIKRMLSDSSLASRMTRRSSSITQCMTTNRRDVRLARTIFTIFLMILICSVPVSVLHAVYDKDENAKYPKVLLGVHILYWSQYCLNMVVYVLMNRQYREAYIDCIARILPSFRKHRSFVFPWENPSVSSRPAAMHASSSKGRNDPNFKVLNAGPENNKVENIRQAGRLSAIPEANTSSCISDDDVFKDDDLPDIVSKGDVRDKQIIKDNESGTEEEKKCWINENGESVPSHKGNCV